MPTFCTCKVVVLILDPLRTFMGGVFGKKKLLSDLQKKMSRIGPKWIGIEVNGARGLFEEKKHHFHPHRDPDSTK